MRIKPLLEADDEPVDSLTTAASELDLLTPANQTEAQPQSGAVNWRELRNGVNTKLHTTRLEPFPGLVVHLTAFQMPF